MTADAIEANEFPEVAGRYEVYAVPKIVINEEIWFEGALPEPLFLEQVLKAAGKLEVAEDGSGE